MNASFITTKSPDLTAFDIKDGRRIVLISISVLFLDILNARCQSPLPDVPTPMSILVTPTDKLNELDALVQQHLRAPTLDERRTAHESAVADFNSRQKEQQAALDSRRQALDEQFHALEQRRLELDTLDKELQISRASATTNESILRFNERVAERNRAVAEQAPFVATYQKAQQAYNDEVAASNARAKEMVAQLDAAGARLNAAGQEHKRWHEAKGPARLFADLDQLFATLSASCAKHPDRTADQAVLVRARALRRELADYTRARLRQDPHGLLAIDATLGTQETITLLVDTGASSCTVSPALVEALGWQAHVGETIQINLAGGITINAPTLLIPRLTVQGYTLEFIKGIVLPEDTLGVDGLLGQSFLSAFDVSISHRNGCRELVLEPRPAATTGLPAFNVFICHEAADQSLGRQLFDQLTARGFHPFFAPVYTMRSGAAATAIAAQQALSDCTHMVVIASGTGKPLFSKWVEAEWQSFASNKRSGRKSGQIVTLLCNGITADSLPEPLRASKTLSHEEPNWESQFVQLLASGAHTL